MRALRDQPAREHGVLTVNLKTNALTVEGQAELEAALKALKSSGNESVAVTYTSSVRLRPTGLGNMLVNDIASGTESARALSSAPPPADPLEA